MYINYCHRLSSLEDQVEIKTVILGALIVQIIFINILTTCNYLCNKYNKCVNKL